MFKRSHFQCPTCEPVLVLGRTRAVCGAVIPKQIVGRGIAPHCGGCERQLPKHQH